MNWLYDICSGEPVCFERFKFDCLLVLGVTIKNTALNVAFTQIAPASSKCILIILFALSVQLSAVKEWFISTFSFFKLILSVNLLQKKPILHNFNLKYL